MFANVCFLILYTFAAVRLIGMTPKQKLAGLISAVVSADTKDKFEYINFSNLQSAQKYILDALGKNEHQIFASGYFGT